MAMLNFPSEKAYSRLHIVVLAALIASTLSGCLTMRRGSLQAIRVESTPAGATVVVERGGATSETPTQILLARRYSQLLRIQKDGFQPETVVIERKASSGLWRNAVWIHPVGWIIGVVVDLSSGSGYDLLPDSISGDLRPVVPEVELSPPGS